MLSATGVLILTALAGLLFYNFSSDAGVIAIASDYVEKNVGYSLSVYREIGIPEENIRMIENSIEEIKYVVVRILPSLFIASVLLVSWINLLMGRSLFLARKMRFPEFGPLNKWKSPDYLVWAVIAAGIMLLIPVKDIKIIGVNALLILLVIYFFQGIAIVAFFFEKKSAPKILRIFLYSLIGFQQILLLVIIIFGFFDVWVDIRRLATKEQNYNE
jgi:uncharacterized protein YybS (DUF2232 family)